MGGFWKKLLNCYGQEVSRENKDKGSRMGYSTEKTISNCIKIFEHGGGVEILRHGNKVINDIPKVIISKTPLRLQKEDESDVFAGTLNERAVAIKVVNMEFASEAIRECEILSKLKNHESIIKLHFEIERIDVIFIILEYFETSLEDYVQMTEEDKDLSAKEICQQLTEAVDFIHKQKVVFLNLNPQNVHLVNVGSHGIQKVKLTNFSNAVQLTDNNTDLRTIRLLNGFVAPEYLSANGGQGFATDIFMLGCIYYYIITNGLKLPRIKDKNQEPKFLGTIQSYQAKNKSSDVVLCLDIASKMTCYMKNKRASTELILKHPFFWSTEKLLNYIIEVAVRIEEKDKTFFTKLESKRKHVVGNDWKKGLEDIYEDISNKREYNGSSVIDLVKAIRNRIVHASTSRVTDVMGSSKEDLKNYWLEMFPYLVPHLYHTMNAHYR